VHELATLLPDHVARREEIARVSSSSSVTRWLERGDLVLVQPGVVALSERSGDWAVRARAAMLWTGGPLSHLSALHAAGLVSAPDGPVHVTVPVARYPRGGSRVIAHRSDRQLTTVQYGQIEAVPPERSTVDAWSWAHSPARNPRAANEAPRVRQGLIEGVRSRSLRTVALRRESDRRRRHAGRCALVALLDLIDGGCESELEIWGALHVLPGPPHVPAPVQQYPVRLAGGRSVRLDAAWPEVCVAVELDGAAFHGSRDARERDLRRDTALAALGWVVLRFSYARLMADPEGCRREIEAVVRGRMANR
jgi:hypothetical protein